MYTCDDRLSFRVQTTRDKWNIKHYHAFGTLYLIPKWFECSALKRERVRYDWQIYVLITENIHLARDIRLAFETFSCSECSVTTLLSAVTASCVSVSNRMTRRWQRWKRCCSGNFFKTDFLFVFENVRIHFECGWQLIMFQSSACQTTVWAHIFRCTPFVTKN